VTPVCAEGPADLTLPVTQGSLPVPPTSVEEVAGPTKIQLLNIGLWKTGGLLAFRHWSFYGEGMIQFFY